MLMIVPPFLKLFCKPVLILFSSETGGQGWEQMRKDPDYEAWILGYFVEDRAVRNPFFGWGYRVPLVLLTAFSYVYGA